MTTKWRCSAFTLGLGREFHPCRLPDQIAGKKHPGLYPPRFELAHESVAGEAGFRTNQ